MEQGFSFQAGAAAFGDGSHPSTRGMLTALDSIDPALFAPAIACDMGCGSGIVSLAIIARFGCPVVAVDISAQAIETVRENALHNGVEAKLLARQSDGFSHPDIAAHAPFDLIVMNILAEPLIALAGDAHRYLISDGVLILSGILLWQEQEVRGAYAALELELTSRIVIGDWVTLVWQKP